MSKHINALDGFTLSDIMSVHGVTFEIGNDVNDFEDDEEEQFPYSANAHLTNAEVLNMINMEEFLDDEKEDDNDSIGAMPCGTSFDKLKGKMIDLTGDEKVMKLVKRQGVGEVVPCNAQVTLKYIGYFEYRDEPFDSTFAHGSQKIIRLNQGQLIPGLEIGICTMQKHEVAVFIIHADLAYGEYGCPPRIPPNEQVMFAVHLVDFLDNGSADTYENLSIEEKKKFPNIITRINHQLNTAKDFFCRGKIKQAAREYRKAVEWLEKAELKNDEEENEMNRVLSKACTNLAVCYNKLDIPLRACSAWNKITVHTAKSYFNYGRALLKMGEYTRAMNQLQSALDMEPGNRTTIKEIQLTNAQQRKHIEMEKSLWKHCLNVRGDNKDISEFQKFVRDMCNNFSRDTNLLRLPLPEGLTPDEDKYIREQAAAFGINVTTHERYGKQTVYLCKQNK